MELAAIGTFILIVRVATAHAEQFLHHLAVDIGQPEVAALVAVRQLGVIDAKEMQDCSLEVVDVNGILDDVIAEIVRSC